MEINFIYEKKANKKHFWTLDLAWLVSWWTKNISVCFTVRLWIVEMKTLYWRELSSFFEVKKSAWNWNHFFDGFISKIFKRPNKKLFTWDEMMQTWPNNPTKFPKLNSDYVYAIPKFWCGLIHKCWRTRWEKLIIKSSWIFL